MKVGDKLICKKDHINYDYGKEYYITVAWSNVVFISNGYFDGYFGDNGTFFLINKSDKNNTYVWDYFYTEVELRKLKLDSINEEG